MTTVSHLQVLITGDAKSLLTTLAKSALATTGFSKTAALAGGAVVGTLAIVGTAAAKMALDFDNAFVRIATLSNASARDIEQWRGQVLELAGETARAPTELADALFFLSSAGLEASQIMPTLEASAKAAAIGLGETEDIANITASALNAYAGSGLEAAEVTDTLVAAVKAGRAEPEEFANALGRILPIASQAGVTFGDVTASLAQLSNIGLDVNEGVTAMRGALQALVAPGTQAEEALASIGLTAQDMLDEIGDTGLVGAIRMLDDAAKQNSATQAEYIGILREVIPNVRALTGVLGLTAQEAAAVDKTFKDVNASSGALDKSMAILEESAGFKLKQALTDMSVLMIELGDTILPAFVVVVQQAARAIEILADAVGFLTPDGLGGEFNRFLKDAVKDVRDVAREAGVAEGEIDALGSAVQDSGETFVGVDEFIKDYVADTINAGLESKGLEGNLGVLDGTIQEVGDEFGRTGQLTREATEALKEQKEAAAAAAGGFLGLSSALSATADAEEEVNRLREAGRQGTEEFSEAVIDATSAQLDLRGAVADYAQDLRDSGATQADVKNKLFDLARQMGITREEFRRAIGPIDDVARGLRDVNKLPRQMNFAINVSYGTVGNVPGGLPHGIAAGGIIRAQGGLITRGPTILAGEGTSSTFAGKGAEAVIPLNNRGIGILGEALQRALGMFDVRRSVARETSGRQARDLLQNIRDDLRRSGILDLSALVKLFAKTATPKEAADFRSAMRDSFRESAGRTVFGQAFRDLRSTLANVANDTGRMADKANADRLINNLKQEWRRTGVFDYERLRRAMRADDVPNTVIRDTLTDIHDTLRGQETERSQRLAKAMQDVTNQSGGDFSANRRKMFIEIKPDRRKFTEALKYDTHYGGGY